MTVLPIHIVDAIKARSEEETFFIYDSTVLTEAAESLRDLPANCKTYFAMKANPNPDVIRHLTGISTIAGVEIASIGEAMTCSNIFGGTLQRTIFTGPGKSLGELKYCIENKIDCITIESLTEAHRINSAVPQGQTQNVLLRIGTNKEIHGAAQRMTTVDEPSPFGVAEELALDAVREIKKLPALNLKGFHYYSATGVLDASALLDVADYTFELTKQLESQVGTTFSTLDLGGGFGIDYPGTRKFDIRGYCSGLRDLIKRHKMEDRKFVLELGRYLTAHAGYFVTRIRDIKYSHGKPVIICAAGINAHRRPYALKVVYPVTIVPMGEKPIYAGAPTLHDVTTAVHGPLCTPADRLCAAVKVEAAAIGDYLVMHKSGAYGLSMSAIEFLSHPRVKEYVI